MILLRLVRCDGLHTEAYDPANRHDTVDDRSLYTHKHPCDVHSESMFAMLL